MIIKDMNSGRRTEAHGSRLKYILFKAKSISQPTCQSNTNYLKNCSVAQNGRITDTIDIVKRALNKIRVIILALFV